MSARTKADQILALEMKLAWLERLVNQLNEAVVSQENRLTQLQNRLQKLEQSGEEQ